MRYIAIAALAALTLTAQAGPGPKENSPSDTSRIVDIEEAVVVASPKQTGKLRNTATSVSLFSADDMVRANVKTLNDLSGYAPNVYMPAYGSSLSSALYIRGIGSRINTPAVGLYVDNVPIADRSAYLFNLLDVNRIDVLRGPQGTLYGRNAMGGIIRLYTQDPMRQQGTYVRLGGSTRDKAGRISVSTYQKLSDQWGFSLAGEYESSKGFFRNDTLHKKVGGRDLAGARMRIVYRPSDAWHFDLTGSYEYTDEDAYPYFYNGVTKGTETYPGIVGRITANRDSRYRRGLLSSSLLAEWQAPLFTVSSVTGYQNLDDRMMMDQDFIYKDIYTLEQKQKANTLTEEIALKSLPGRRWEWTGGLFGLYEALRTSAPVVFYTDGVSMLNQTFARYLPSISYPNPYTGQSTTMPLSLTLSDPSFAINDDFRTPVLNGALYFQGTLHDLCLPRLSLTMGLRLDYEHQQMTYRGGGNTVNYAFSMQEIQPAALSATPTLNGKIQNDYTRLLPKIAIQYDFNNGLGNVYATVSEGHRSGGYNIQMFSEVMSTMLEGDMMTGTKNYCDNLLQGLADNARNETVRQMFLGIKQTMDKSIPTMATPDVASTVTYKPEYCWNYEAGTHLNLLDKALTADLSFFFIDTHDQQIVRFTQGGLGRMMVNAGRSHSCGIEAALHSHMLDDRLALSINYGYTHAVFKKYDAGNGYDYTDNRVPFIPEHSLGLMADYTQPLQGFFAKSITFGVNGNGCGRIYWTESNNTYQNFYATLGAHLLIDLGDAELNLWGKNLTETNYKTFYFESMNRGYYQKGNPFQLGFDLKIKI